MSSVVVRSSSPILQTSPSSVDPTTTSYSLSAFAIGDWGTTTYKSSCCTRSSSYNNYDVNAEDVVAILMNTEAGNMAVKPKVIIGHGDNFYWTGINSFEGRDWRFATTFEEKFNGNNIRAIPWVNVLGNHDYGGASYVCNDGDNNARCANTAELLQGIENKFQWQSTYTSPNDNRWHLPDHSYEYWIEDAATGVSIEIFNIDTNDADVHGAMQICCQCYGYSNGDSATCRNVGRGHQFCCGGDTAMFDACMAKFKQWGDDSRARITRRVRDSTATWKIVNSHYSAYNHYGENGMRQWFDILRGSGVHVWLNGHTHGEKHDYSASLGIHFIENGAGGGIQREAASGIPAYASSFVKNLWTYSADEYGFMSLQASKNWLKLQYHTAEKSWQFGENIQSTKIGGVATKHCWYIPSDGGEGRRC
ncbi:Purple (tartrate-resistant) acid phosphatase [Plasmopara halstedii]|uniref:Purple (Tartrate-resistant) acid phosphatase n=1 Tax=Plasmopara halstedii TaxID=4781 RepID=A0A0P1AIR6_PLAHL|nr:Purple (tartrate-resistant) acid phosphatase [Plasmopara halstedii]CEG41040.1 Purple (tartrate-resistant) acid phosphatase [Plasmopara halstedii]|eukprot:XP_024577409.1 Purple (tartrate-resistant) acid phosphatase [Plasmopara halstedii]